MSSAISESTIRLAADRLLDAEATLVPCAPIRDLLDEGDVRAAYLVQQEARRRYLAAGRRVVGRKIGLTSEAVQRQLGVDQPDYGVLYADTVFPSGSVVPTSGLLQPRIEAEVAFVMATELAAPDVTPLEVQRAIEWVAPALEIVDSRIADWDISITDTIADNASAGRTVVGEVRAWPRALENKGMSLWRNGKLSSTGNTSACLGHPLVALHWLARRLADAGDPIQPGDLVLSGALGPMVAVRAGDAIRAEIDGVGGVEVAFDVPDTGTDDKGGNA